ncbi:hypothetical protein M0812_27725 [Anaeramoeba flamelloides]|uniref:Uncharacterized protein n=1 Tax=Anaeramoeba flamelloides TaxID=1746091 RepID=A0AAV7YAY1_9EUKA|nr:hypothetical protein M0812_27725 [Anaeramoeba flamelloides]
MTSQKQILTVSRTPRPLRIKSRAKIGSRIRSEMKKEHLEAFYSFRDYEQRILESLKTCKNKKRLEILNRHFPELVVIEKNRYGKPTHIIISGKILGAIYVAFRSGSSSVRKSISTYIKTFGLCATKNPGKVCNCLSLEFKQPVNIISNPQKLSNVQTKKKKRRKTKFRIKSPIQTIKGQKNCDRKGKNKHTHTQTNTITSTKQNLNKGLNVKQEMINKKENFIIREIVSQEVNRKRNPSLNNTPSNFIEKKRKYTIESSLQDDHHRFKQKYFQNENCFMNKNVTNYNCLESPKINEDWGLVQIAEIILKLKTPRNSIC